MPRKFFIFVFLPFLLLLVGACGSPGTNADSDEIKQISTVFSEYRAAVLDSDGQKAVELVDQRSITWYEEALEQAKEFPAQDLERLDFSRKFVVLRLRHEFNLQQLNDFSGQSLFVYAVENEWVSRAGVENMQLGEVRVEQYKATASTTEAPNAFVLTFFKEREHWKFAIWPLFALADEGMQDQIRDSGFSEKEFIIAILNTLSEFQVDEQQIYDGPRK